MEISRKNQNKMPDTTNAVTKMKNVFSGLIIVDWTQLRKTSVLEDISIEAPKQAD